MITYRLEWRDKMNPKSIWQNTGFPEDKSKTVVEKAMYVWYRKNPALEYRVLEVSTKVVNKL